MDEGPAGGSLEQLRGLRARADEDFLRPAADAEPGRHRVDVAELGLRVSVTRARYPNRADGRDQYAVTISRPALDHPPQEAEVRTVLVMAFEELAERAVERSAHGSLVRMFRVPAAIGVGADQAHETTRSE
jgi:hypothetical protein